ncbi:hypothetical protein PPL_08823 [Heterostelium album PN500]|uniref:Uncharacterized protein n=1 Tax=Heterostelium pallidum (strain ATCC 26659 / Pp 5 / PN500) TaxID=670386 RepID=D3BJU3_HETP5|nr:hypothetical protein PPL_08823 [Heterostelium album PN500]EFA78173.1 hypothetical protein PPL_08823 [Heterostelium album PN500]|eukprot:XP_020430299.1 hypothetical protein PPL_08823 [Heterostelium album PN500]
MNIIIIDSRFWMIWLVSHSPSVGSSSVSFCYFRTQTPDLTFFLSNNINIQLNSMQ